MFPNFQNCAFCEKDLKDNKHNRLHLERKYARIFVLGHYVPQSSQFSLNYTPGKTVSCFSELIVCTDKHLRIFSRQMKDTLFNKILLKYLQWWRMLSVLEKSSTCMMLKAV